MRQKQFNLFKEKTSLSHGGTLGLGKRKTARPLSQKRPVHIVLKSSTMFLLLRNKKLIESKLHKFSCRFGVKLYQLGIQDDHVHLNVLLPNQTLYKRWIRSITSTLACEIKGLKWKLIPFTRIGSWGRDFKSVTQYIQGNAAEGDFILAAHLRVGEWSALQNIIGEADG